MASLGALEASRLSDLESSAGVRDVLAHEHVATDLDLVAATVGRAAAAYRGCVSAVADWLRSQR